VACCGRAARGGHPIHRCAWPLGIGVAAIFGMVMLGVRPSGRFAGDQERLAFIVLPLVTLVESLAAALQPARWWAMGLRALVAASLWPILLHGSVYLGGGVALSPHAWKPAEKAAMLGGAAAALTAVLLILTETSRHASRSVLLGCLALTTAATGITMMLSGYLTGGQHAMPLAAALVVACGMSAVVGSADDAAGVGVGFVGLAGLTTIGHFFGSLSEAHAVVLVAVPLISWLAEAGLQQRLGPRWRALVAVAGTAVVLAWVVWQAYVRFDAASTTTRAHEAGTADVQDYLNFGR